MIVEDLRSLARDQDAIKWKHPQIRLRWIEVFKLFRALDKYLAVPVYSYFATDPESVRHLLDREEFTGDVWEPCSGDGAIAREIEARGYKVHASDLRDHADVYGTRGVDLFDLVSAQNVITNPPFWNALAVAKHLISIATDKVALLQRIEFLGSKSRKPFFLDNPPARVYPLPSRPTFAVGGDGEQKQSTKWEYGWYVWERGFVGKPRIIH